MTTFLNNLEGLEDQCLSDMAFATKWVQLRETLLSLASTERGSKGTPTPPSLFIEAPLQSVVFVLMGRIQCCGWSKGLELPCMAEMPS
jgi:hypothetical protein